MRFARLRGISFIGCGSAIRAPRSAASKRRFVSSSSCSPWSLADMSIAPLDKQIRYPDVGRCIYCPPGGPTPAKLGDEHIIPLSFGGRRILPSASCPEHEGITTIFEDQCCKGLIDTARYHMGLPSRRKIKIRSKLPIRLDNNKTELVYFDKHPSALIMPQLPLATIHLGLHETEDLPPVARMSITPLGKDFAQRARQLRKPANLTRGFSSMQFYG
jgi:hypothetical protein